MACGSAAVARYAGIDNELSADHTTAVLFSDATARLKALHAGLQAYIG